jgi:pimeloyl-ACP methyl ester carboxylesterase
MARRWAQLGFDVLRVDLSGLGDSLPERGVEENLTYPPSALGDLEEAIVALGSRPAIIAGLCSGGDYAFQMGAHSPNAAGAWMLNPRTFCVLDLAAVEAGEGQAPATTPVAEVPAMLRRMAERGLDTVLLVSRNDPGVAFVDARAGEQMRGLSELAPFHRFDVEFADHTFTPVSTQQRISDLLTEHLLART